MSAALRRLRKHFAFAPVALLCALLGAIAPVTVVAQAWPIKAVKIVVPFPPGGGADTLARIMGPKLADIWGQPVIVENKPGASGTLGADAVAQSAADGYTLLMSSTASLTEKNVAQFAPVTLVSASAYVVTVNANVKATDIRELVALAKAAPASSPSAPPAPAPLPILPPNFSRRWQAWTCCTFRTKAPDRR